MELFGYILSSLSGGILALLIKHYLESEEKKKEKKLLLNERSLHLIYAPLFIKTTLIQKYIDEIKMSISGVKLPPENSINLRKLNQRIRELTNDITNISSENFGYLKSQDEFTIIEYIKFMHSLYTVDFLSKSQDKAVDAVAEFTNRVRNSLYISLCEIKHSLGWPFEKIKVALDQNLKK